MRGADSVDGKHQRLRTQTANFAAMTAQRIRRRHLRLLWAVPLTVAVAVASIVWMMHRPLELTDDVLVFIPMNTSVVAAVDSVDAHCNLPTPWLVSLTARLVVRATDATIQSGWYVISPDDDQWDVVQILFDGERRPTVRLTIPEGLTYKEIGGLVRRVVESDSAAFVAWCEDDDTIDEYAAGAPSIEGYLMPDTYDFFWRAPAEQIGERLAEEFRRRHADSIPSLEQLTLASIIQAEAVVRSEMPRISGVYVNRLERGMRLAADPTVQYGLGAKKRLLYRDLEKDTPYNTYMHPGLPPGPINNPGMSAVVAARHPEKHGYLFFVARGDGSGKHRFAKSGWEHQQNVQRYRSARREGASAE